MSNTSPSLLDKLGTFLSKLEGATNDAPVAVAAEDPAPSNAVQERLGKFTEVMEVLAQLTDRLKERMALLQVACQETRLLPPREVRLHPRLALQKPAIIDLLRVDPVAARLTAPAVLRFYEAHDDVVRMQELLGQGRLDALNLEAMRGKYMFLSKIQLYFKDHPLLAALFRTKAQAPAAPPPAEPAEAARPAPPPPVGPDPMQPTGDRPGTGQLPARTGTGSLAPTGDRPAAPVTGPRVVQAGADSLRLGAGRPATGTLGTPPPVAAIARPLLDKLELRILILRAAVDPIATIQRKSAALLPPPAQETARALAAALELAPDYLARAREAVKQHQEARILLERRGDPARLRTLCTELSILPRRMAGHPLLEKLFAA